MEDSQEFEIYANIYESRHTTVFRAKRKKDQRAVLLKQPRGDFLSGEDIARLKYEYELLKSLNIKGIPQVLDLKELDQKLTLILDDDGYEPLSSFYKKGVISLKNKIITSINIAKIIHEIHSADILHRDIKTDNIIIHPKSNNIKIIDFGIAIKMSEEQQIANPTEQIFGTLSYMPPERTGKMNRLVDKRSDYYSYGVTLYEIFTESLPFVSEEPLEIIHSHLAIKPLPPHERVNSVPVVLSQIIMKLLEKNAEDRYQSTAGILYDLENALDLFLINNSIQTFRLGTHDFSTDFYLQEKLYGRENEIDQIMQEFEKISVSNKELILVSGSSGLGKTALINELVKPCASRHSFLIKGKFDPYMRNLPFQALGSAFTQLIYQLLSLSDEKILEWKNKILTAVRGNCDVLIEIVPQLELLVGPQPKIPNVGIEETEKRFTNVWLNLISVFAEPQKPLIICLDDLQWASSAALKLITKIVTSDLINHVLVIGSYREGEIKDNHSLLEFIAELEKTRQQPVKRISLSPLSKDNIRSLITDSFHMDAKKADMLTSICYEKTGCNPFFLKQFLKILYDKKLIFCNKSSGIWDCDIQNILEEKVTDNVTELMVEKINKLAPSTKDVIQAAACIGNEFNLDVLLSLVNMSRQLIVEDLLILKRGAYIYVSEGILEHSVEDCRLNVTMKFTHDKFQESAHTMLSSTKRHQIHLQIALGLCKEDVLPSNSLEQMKVASHFNLAKEIIIDQHEIVLAAKSNLNACKRARETANNETALYYCREGLNYLNKIDSNHRDEQLTFEMNWELAICLFLNGAYDEAEIAYEKVLKLAKNDYERAELLLSHMELNIIRHKYNKVIEDGIEIYANLGVKVKKKPTTFEVLLQYVKIRSLMILPDKKKNLYTKAADDKRFLLLAKIFAKMHTPLFLNDLNLLAIFSFKVMELSMSFGSCANTALALGDVALISEGFGFYRTQQKLVDLFRVLYAKFAEKEDVKISFFYLMLFQYKFHPLKEAITSHQKNFLDAMEMGNMETAITSLHQMINAMIVSGFSIEEILAKINSNSLTILAINDIEESACLRSIQLNLSLLADIRAPDTQLSKISIEDINGLIEKKFLKLKLDHTSVSTLSAFILEDFPKCFEKNADMEQAYNENFGRGVFAWILWYYLSPLILIEQLRRAPESEKDAIKKRLNVAISRLAHYAHIYPMNTKSKYLLVLAELEGMNNPNVKALKTFQDAINAAQESGIVYELALAYELTARFLMRNNFSDAAFGYIRQALHHYTRWGAHAKIKQMEKKYKSAFADANLNLFETAESSQISLHGNTTSSSTTTDVDALLKASQAISSEIRLEKLVEIILRIIMQSSGAEKVVLMLYKNKKLIINGVMSTKGDWESSQESLIDYKLSKIVPRSVIDFVRNTSVYMIDNDISNNITFNEDPYIKEENTHSILCYPLQHSGRLVGILYLENNLAKAAFTNKQVSVLNVLSGEIATMLETANSYHSFERFVPKEFLAPLGREKISDIEVGDHIDIKISTLFADIRGFTQISEQLSAQETFELLNRYLNQINPIILKWEGFIDKYIGDAIMALFASTPDNALAAAIEMQSTLKQHQAEIVGTTGVVLQIGIGLNLGSAILGVLGSHERMATTVVSDSVNVSSRLETLCKYYGLSILITENFLAALNFPERYIISFVDKVILMGKTEGICIYEVRDFNSANKEAMADLNEAYLKAWDLYSGGDFKTALEEFLELEKRYPQEKKLKIHIERCQEFLINVPESWNGTVRLKIK